MTPDEARQYVQQWKQAGPLLEKFRREELRRFQHEPNMGMIDSLLEVGLLHAQPRTATGMVEMQRILARARR